MAVSLNRRRDPTAFHNAHMRYSIIVPYHFLAFIAGGFLIAAYFFYKISALPSEAAIAVVALIPAAAVYIIDFGIACLISFGICLTVSYLRKRATQ